MANNLPKEKQVAAIAALAEGSSIRSIERMTGIHRDTIMRLGVRVGEGCEIIADQAMRNLPCRTVQLDEIWGYIGKKQKQVKRRDPAEYGDVWTFVAIDADSKVVPSFRVGKRDSETANAFLSDLAGRMKNRIQLSTDAMAAYAEAIESSFGGAVDYAQIVKSYSTAEPTVEGKYSPPEVVAVRKAVYTGNPDKDKISTSYIERQNLTLRMHCRRLTRLTNAFSKKLDNFKAAIALHFAYYNFVLVHKSIRTTPAMAAGVTNKLWTVADLVEMTT